jgi:excisionase family DNA binding protein
MAHERAEFRTVKETAEVLRIGITQAYNAIHAGEIKAVKIGGSYRVPDGEIERLKRGEAAAQ